MCAPSLFGIVINDANDPAYITGNTNYTGVAAIFFSIGQSQAICTGTLMQTGMHILTAGHCVDGASNWSVTFQTGSGNTTIAVVNSDLHPLYSPRPAPLGGISEYDVAILTLASLAPPDAERYGLKLDFNGITTATQLDLVGYGRGDLLPSQVRRHAVNTMDGVIGSINGVPTPDNPLLMSLQYGTGAGNEGIVSSGDSGGPALFGNLVLGVASFAFDIPANYDYQTGTTYQTGHASLAETVTGTWVANTLSIPEPGTFLLAGIALLVVAKAGKRLQ